MQMTFHIVGHINEQFQFKNVISCSDDTKMVRIKFLFLFDLINDISYL